MLYLDAFWPYLVNRVYSRIPANPSLHRARYKKKKILCHPIRETTNFFAKIRKFPSYFPEWKNERAGWERMKRREGINGSSFEFLVPNLWKQPEGSRSVAITIIRKNGCGVIKTKIHVLSDRRGAVSTSRYAPLYRPFSRRRKGECIYSGHWAPLPRDNKVNGVSTFE